MTCSSFQSQKVASLSIILNGIQRPMQSHVPADSQHLNEVENIGEMI